MLRSCVIKYKTGLCSKLRNVRLYKFEVLELDLPELGEEALVVPPGPVEPLAEGVHGAPGLRS